MPRNFIEEKLRVALTFSGIGAFLLILGIPFSIASDFSDIVQDIKRLENAAVEQPSRTAAQAVELKLYLEGQHTQLRERAAKAREQARQWHELADAARQSAATNLQRAQEAAARAREPGLSAEQRRAFVDQFRQRQQAMKSDLQVVAVRTVRAGELGSNAAAYDRDIAALDELIVRLDRTIEVADRIMAISRGGDLPPQGTPVGTEPILKNGLHSK